ncbi:hypothetical protein IAT38_000150 [Cryptococcus sp. DSM 104549]
MQPLDAHTGDFEHAKGLLYGVATGHHPALSEMDIPGAPLSVPPLTQEQKQSIDNLVPFLSVATTNFDEISSGNGVEYHRALLSYLNGLKYGVVGACPGKTESVNTKMLNKI